MLDWYNPYMDFIGHASFVQYMLYFSVIVLAFVEYFCPAKKKHYIIVKKEYNER